MVHRPYNYCPRCGDKKEIVRMLNEELTLEKYRNKYELKKEYLCMEKEI